MACNSVINYTWVIENFSKCLSKMDKILEESNSDFQLNLFPDESNKNTNNCVIIRVVSNSNTKISKKIKYHLAVMGKNQEKLLIQGRWSIEIFDNNSLI